MGKGEGKEKEEGRQGKEGREGGQRKQCYFKIGFLSVVVKKSPCMLGKCPTIELYSQLNISVRNGSSFLSNTYLL